MARKNAELSACLKDTQRRLEALTAAAEELSGKHITVCRYRSPAERFEELAYLFHLPTRYACALEEKLASLESASEAGAMKLQQQLAQMHSRHLQEMGFKERCGSSPLLLHILADIFCVVSTFVCIFS
jgi:hypothetical protein